MSVASQIKDFYDIVGGMRRSGYRVDITRKPGFDKAKLMAELVIEGNPRVWIYDWRDRVWGTYPADDDKEE